MKKALLISFAAMASLTAAAQDVIDINFTSENFHQVYFADDADWYTTIKVGVYEFFFDIYGAPAEGLVSGQAYTLEDMEPEYSFGIDYTVLEKIAYASVSYVEVQNGDGSKDIDVNILDSNAISYHLVGNWAPSDEPEMIQMPEGLNVIDCVLTCDDMDYGEETFPARLAIDGSDVYLEGCGYVSYFFESAIKGSLTSTGFTFPAGQCVGFGSTSNYFIFGLDMNTLENCDIVFTYNEEVGGYVCESSIYVCQDAAGDLNSYYEIVSNLVLIPSEIVGIEAVKTAETFAAKRMINGKLQIEANGMRYDAAGRRAE